MSECTLFEKPDMMIADPVHGTIPLCSLQSDLIKTVEMQRLHSIHQLGMTFHVYPSAHSMRFPHALGVSHLARRMGVTLVLNNPDLALSDKNRRHLVNMITAAGLLHDICHTPWSHTLEPLFLEITQKNHMDLVKDIMTGSVNFPIRGAGKIPEILRDHDIKPEDVAELICQSYSGPYYAQQVIFGEVDADTLDYLCRDFHFSGVSFGHIDIDRLLQTMVAKPDRLYFQTKGLQAVRDFLNARIEMFSAVYLHKMTRIADMMFLKAARMSIAVHNEYPAFWSMTDDELLSGMIKSPVPYVNDIAWRLKYRQDLFKRVYHLESGAVGPRERHMLNNISKLGDTPRAVAEELEKIICEIAGISEGYLIVDMVSTVTDISEARFKELDILFIDKSGRKLKLAELDSTFAEYIQHAQPSRSILSIYTPSQHKDKCLKALPGIMQRFES